MSIRVEKVTSSERTNLEKLLQLYLHELSLYFPITYEYDLNKYFDNNYAFFIKLGNDILGFVLIDDNSENNYEISEMFVLNNYKGKKVGEEAVKKIFDIYKGNWTIKAVPLSPKAESFWKKTVNNYTNGNFKLEHTGKYKRAELYFKNN